MKGMVIAIKNSRLATAKKRIGELEEKKKTVVSRVIFIAWKPDHM